MAKRSNQQNKALHLWIEFLAEELDRHGHTMQNVLERITRAEVRPTAKSIKECVWRPAQIAVTGKESSKDLDKLEVDKIYELLNKWLGDNFDGLHIPFPSAEDVPDLLKAIEKAKNIDYPDDYKKPKI